MLVYSKNIVKFIGLITTTIKDILANELKVIVVKDGFFTGIHSSFCPLKVVIYNTGSKLGYFDPEFLELGFHERLMFASKEQLHSVIKHELAHYMTFLKFGGDSKPHGEHFKGFCKSVGWGEEISSASICLEDVEHSCLAASSNTFRKVQKLLALASSSNRNEAEQAMIKSRELLLKHHADSESLNFIEENEEKIYLRRVFKQKRSDAKMAAIAHILNTFFVNTVYNHCNGFTYLEIIGSFTNIEIAEYIANVLKLELDRLWLQAKKEYAHLKGLIAKNSFFWGVAKGYCNKINALKSTYSSDIGHTLMVLEKKLADAESLIYSNLTKSRSSRQYCRHSSDLGEKAGSRLHFNAAVGRAEKKSGRSIGFDNK